MLALPSSPMQYETLLVSDLFQNVAQEQVAEAFHVNFSQIINFLGIILDPTRMETPARGESRGTQDYASIYARGMGRSLVLVEIVTTKLSWILHSGNLSLKSRCLCFFMKRFYFSLCRWRSIAYCTVLQIAVGH